MADRRSLFKCLAAGLAAGAGGRVAVRASTAAPIALDPNRCWPHSSEGPLLADDATGTTAYADFIKEWYGRRGWPIPSGEPGGAS
jgi:hypothetical protein